MIFTGAFLSGERLPPERELADFFGVSRPAVHDALLKLQAEGLVKMRPRHGCVVKDFSSLASISLLTELYLNNRLDNCQEIEAGLVEFRQMILEKITEKLLRKIKKFSTDEKDDFFIPLENLLEFSDCKKEVDIKKLALEDFKFYCKFIELSDEQVFLLFFKMAEIIYIHQLSQFLKEDLSYTKMISKNKKEFLAILKSGNKSKAIAFMKTLTDPETYRREKCKGF